MIYDMIRRDMMSTRLHKSTILLLIVVNSICSHLASCYNVTVTDNVQPGTVIADLKSLLLNDLQLSVLTGMTYVFLSGHNETAFRLDSSSGLIKAGTQLDRDRLCPSVAVCQHKLDIGLRKVDYFKKISLFVDFADENDNSPRFPSSRVRLNISESTPVGSELPIQAANDIDGPANGIDEYLMTSSASDLPFDLRVSRSADGMFELKLVLTKSLDREKVSVYNVQLTAADRGRPSLTGTALIDISVTDVNDNQPVFSQSVYNVEVDETPSGGNIYQMLVTVRATDADSGANGRVKYAFSKRTATSLGEVFSIDKETGQIFLTRGIDFEKDQSFSLDVLAQDEGPNPSPVQARVNVKVRDVNDLAPVVEMSSLYGRSHSNESLWRLILPEHSRNGTEVGHLSVSDSDSGQGGDVTCSMRQQPIPRRPHFHLVELAPGEYTIVTSDEQLDREVTARFELAVSCQDHGHNMLSTNLQIIIDVKDINDQRPVFSQNLYNAEVKENSEPLEMLARVTATDADTDEFNEITYSLLDPRGFAIDPKRGVIWTNASFDREVADHYELKVIAYNKMAPASSSESMMNPGTATSTVLVHILDINDQPPRFTQSHYVMNVSENMPVDTLVGHVTAIDSDLPPHNISYHLDVSEKQHRTVGQLFYVESRTGRVMTRKSLNREEQLSYQLTVVARDDVIQSLHDSAVVTVYVTDVNDQSPVISFPSLNNNTVYVTSDATLGSHVTKIEANDADDGDNALLRYFLSPVTEQRVFRIDVESGEIFVNDSLLEYNLATFKLDLLVQDSGTPSNVAKATLFVAVKPPIVVRESMSRPQSAGFVLPLLELRGTRLALVIIVFTGCIIVVVASCFAVCIVIRKQRKARHFDDSNSHSDSDAKQTTDSVNITTTLPPPPSYMTSDGVTRLHHVLSNSAANDPPPTPAADSLCSSSCQGPGGRTSSMATASLCIEDDEQWDNLPRPPSLSYCVSTTGYRGALLSDTLLARRPLPLGSASQLHPASTLNTRALGDGSSSTLGRYDVCNPSTMSHLYDRVCVPNDVNRIGLYGNVMTSSIGLGPRMVPHSSQHPHRLSAEHRVVVTDPSAAQDEWMYPTSHKSNFSTWLTKESFQLQQNGHRYRIAGNTGYGNTNINGDETKSPDTFSHTSGYGSVGLSDVTRSRLHSDTDVKDSRNVHFDDATCATVTSSTAYGSLRKPIVINCATTPERYISLG